VKKTDASAKENVKILVILENWL